MINHFVKLYNSCFVKMCCSSLLLYFLLESMAFITGTHQDTLCPLGLTWLGLSHMLPLTFTGPSYSSASEVISIFWMTSFRRLCCFSSMLDISFILERTTSIYVAHWIDLHLSRFIIMLFEGDAPEWFHEHIIERDGVSHIFLWPVLWQSLFISIQ